MNTPKEIHMVLAIEQPTTWREFIESPDQDPENLAAEAYRHSRIMVSPDIFAESVSANHELIIGLTAEILEMDFAQCLKLAQARQILWKASLMEEFVRVKGPGTDWLPAIGIQASVL